VRPDIQRLAQANMEALGLAGGIEFRLRDIADGFDEENADALFLDVRRPWHYLRQVEEALKDGGFFGATVPTVNQVIELVSALENREVFGHIEIEEVLVRSYKAVPARLRPVDRMVAHTGYLVFARKVSSEVGETRYWMDRRRRKYEEAQARTGETDEPDTYHQDGASL
jgi:tRNA (adenine57-N1/adenine58-N1)-methyltransferase